MSFLRPVATLLVAIFMLMAGSGVLPAIVGLRLDQQGYTATTIGLVGASYFAGLTLGSITVFGVVRRVGHIRAFSAFVSLYSAATLGYVLMDNVWLWLLLRLINGYSAAGIFVCLESWLNDRAVAEKRGGTLAGYMIALYGGQALSQGFLGIGGANAALPFILSAIILSLTVLPIALTHMVGPVMEQQQNFSLRQLYGVSPLGLFGVTVTGVMLGGFYALGAVHAQRLALSQGQIALLMGSVIAGGMLLQWPLGRLSDRFDRRAVIIGVFAATALTSVAIAMTLSPAPLIALGALYGGLIFALYPLCVAHANDHLEADERISASGGLILAYSMGAAVGPLVGAVAMRLLGPGGLYFWMAVCGTTGCGFGLWRQYASDSIPDADQLAFQILPRTTPMMAALDPEAPSEEALTDGARPA